MARKISRKELLKEPDEFLTITAQTIQYTKENPKKVFILSLIIAIIVLTIAGFYLYQRQGKLASHDLLERALMEYRLLETPGQQPTDEQLNKILAQFDNIVTNYPSFTAGEMALLYSGHILYKKHDYRGALDRYTRMQNTKLIKQGLGPLAVYHIAMTLFALKDYDHANAMFDQLSKDTNSPYHREAHAAIARIYEDSGKNKEAVQAYRQYLKMFPEAPDANFVKYRIAELSLHS